MCGIFGYAGKASKNKTAMLHHFVYWLAAESETRGVDSTGFAARFSSGHVVVDKMPFRASVFTRMSHKFKLMARNMPTTLIGHTRLGTGSSPVINNNNHPFIGNDYHMVHNGVIPSWRDIAREHSLDMHSETDSEIVLRLLENNVSGKKLPTKVQWILDNVWGNMAIALMQKDEPNIWLFRNENPIHVFDVPAEVFGNSFLFFCSTKSIFDSAWKNAIGGKPQDKKVAAHYLDDNHLFKISTKHNLFADGSRAKFIVNRLRVSRKFRVGKQYYGKTIGASDESGRHHVSTSAKRIYSKVVDVNDVSKGCSFTDNQLKTINSTIKEKNGSKKILIDGMTVNEYASLKTLVNDILNFEDSKLASTN